MTTIRILDRKTMKDSGCKVNQCGYICDTSIILMEDSTTYITTAFAQKSVQAAVKKIGAKWVAAAKAWVVARRVTEAEIIVINAAHDVKLCKPAHRFVSAAAKGEWPTVMTLDMQRAAKSGATWAEYVNGSAN